MRIRVFPYKQGSASARSLADALGARVLRLQGSTFRPRQRDVLINWGSSQPTPTGYARTLNRFASVAAAANKLHAFTMLRDANVSIPNFWTDRNAIPADAFPIVCRTVLNGHSGRGIVVADSADQLVDAPLYTQYIPKQDEYRVHVVGGQVVAVQRKTRRHDVENPNWRIRNHGNGFNFVRGGVDAPVHVLEQSIMAITALGLDFGGVDVVWNERRQLSYVLEVNTACGLEGQTVDDYANAFRGLLANG